MCLKGRQRPKTYQSRLTTRQYRCIRLQVDTLTCFNNFQSFNGDIFWITQTQSDEVEHCCNWIKINSHLLSQTSNITHHVRLSYTSSLRTTLLFACLYLCLCMCAVQGCVMYTVAEFDQPCCIAWCYDRSFFAYLFVRLTSLMLSICVSLHRLHIQAIHNRWCVFFSHAYQNTKKNAVGIRYDGFWLAHLCSVFFNSFTASLVGLVTAYVSSSYRNFSLIFTQSATFFALLRRLADICKWNPSVADNKKKHTSELSVYNIAYMYTPLCLGIEQQVLLFSY